MIMMSYLNRLEALVERWQSRRKTIEISHQERQQTTREEEEKDSSKDLEGEDSKMEESFPELENEIEGNKTRATARTARGNDTKKRKKKEKRNIINKISGTKALAANCTGLLYVALLISLASLILATPSQLAPMTGSLKQEQQPLSSMNPIINHLPTATTIQGIDWKLVGSRFVKQLAANLDLRQRWSRIPFGNGLQQTEVRDRLRPPSGNSNRRGGQISEAISRISNRIGARNSIRVHNAFRDFVWRILERFSMPTPVIYELRRQNFYSPEDDQMNDSLYNKNTTRTIRARRAKRAKRHSGFGREMKSGSINLLGKINRRQDRDDDDDDESDNFRDRIRSRLEDLVSLSRRSLFGRVIRVPTLFPFKRQEEEVAGHKQQATAVTTTTKTSTDNGTTTRKKKSRSRWRRKKDSDRQMISINGKQYYVNDDGELKDWNDQVEDS